MSYCAGKLFKLFLIACIPITIFGCDSNSRSQLPDIAFIEPFPKRSINLSWVLGEQFSMANNTDTGTFNISFDKKTRLNMITKAETGDTVTICGVSRFRNYYYFSEKLADSTFRIYAVKIGDDQIRGLVFGFSQMTALLLEVEKGNFKELVTFRDDDIRKYRLKFDRIKLRKFYEGLADTMPAMKIFNTVKAEKIIQDTIPAASAQDQWMKSGGPVKNIFPNPATDHFTVEFGEEGNFRIELYNQGGQLLQTVNTTADKATLQTGDLLTGFYVVKVSETESGESANFKLLIRR